MRASTDRARVLDYRRDMSAPDLPAAGTPAGVDPADKAAEDAGVGTSAGRTPPAGDAVPAGDAASSGQPVPVESDPLAQVLAKLEAIDDVPLADRAAVFESMHDALSAALAATAPRAEAGEGAEPSGPAPRGTGPGEAR